MTANPIFFNGFEEFISTNHTFDTNTRTVDLECYNRGFFSGNYPTSPTKMSIKDIETLSNGSKAFVYKTVAMASSGDTLYDIVQNDPNWGFSPYNAISFRVKPLLFKQGRITINGVSTNLSMCYIASFTANSASLDKTDLYAIESGGLLMTTSTPTEHTSSSVVLTSLSTSGAFGSFDWTKDRYITITDKSIYESENGKVFDYSAYISGSFTYGMRIKNTGGLLAQRQYALFAGTTAPVAGQILSSVRLDDVVFWTGLTTTAPNVFVRSLPQTSLSTTGTQYGSGTLSEKLSTYDYDANGVGLNMGETISSGVDVTAINSEFTNPVVHAVQVSHQVATSQSTYTYNVDINYGAGTATKVESLSGYNYIPEKSVITKKNDGTQFSTSTLSGSTVSIRAST